MNYVRNIALLLLLLAGGSFSFAFPSGIDNVSSENENGYHLSEDFQDLSYSNLVAPLNLFTNRTPLSSTPILTFEILRESSGGKGYFIIIYLIEPGLGLEDIIFPFHSFL